MTNGPDTPLVHVEGISKSYRVHRRLRPAEIVRAVRDVSLDIMPGEVVGLVGESGSGKSTVGRLTVGLEDTDTGSISVAGHTVSTSYSSEMHHVRRIMQIIFQDPRASLNPHMRIERIVREPLVIHRVGGSREEIAGRVSEMLGVVGLGRDFLKRFPAELSGGQQQRVAIARALILNPKFIVADEPITSLDVSIRAQIINLLEELRIRFDLSMLFISHDLSVVRHICDRVYVMYKGRIVESGSARSLFKNPAHPYTQALLSAIPIPDPDVERARTPIRFDPASIAGFDEAEMIEVEPGHLVARHG
jgi:ABC-type oligopeptide transport system ATPase subunit